MKKAAKKEGPQQKQGPSSAVVLGSSVASVSLRRDIRVTLRASQCGCTLSQLINVNWCGGERTRILYLSELPRALSHRQSRSRS
jgi:hypothetical protein